MGSGSSTSRHSASVEVISPRVETGTSETILDSSPLHDVGHGTIHYRYKLPEHSVHEYSTKQKNNMSTGYFFHPKLKDFNESADVINEDARKFIKVVKGPISDENRNVFYISGIGRHVSTSAVPKSLLSALKDGQADKRIFGHRYYVLTNAVNHKEDKSQKLNTVGEFSMSSDAEVTVSVKETCSVNELKKLLSLHYIVPVSILHVLGSSNEELSDDSLVIDGISNCVVSSEVISVVLSVV